MRFRLHLFWSCFSIDFPNSQKIYCLSLLRLINNYNSTIFTFSKYFDGSMVSKIIQPNVRYFSVHCIKCYD